MPVFWMFILSAYLCKTCGRKTTFEALYCHEKRVIYIAYPSSLLCSAKTLVITFQLYLRPNKILRTKYLLRRCVWYSYHSETGNLFNLRARFVIIFLCLLHHDSSCGLSCSISLYTSSGVIELTIIFERNKIIRDTSQISVAHRLGYVRCQGIAFARNPMLSSCDDATY